MVSLNLLTYPLQLYKFVRLVKRREKSISSNILYLKNITCSNILYFKLQSGLALLSQGSEVFYHSLKDTTVKTL